MHPQLQLIADEYRSAQARLHELVRAVPAERWPRRAEPARWSVAECLGHLNLTSLAYVPLLSHAVSRARMLERRPPSRYRRDPIGWLLWATMGPPVRFRTKTIARFLPASLAAPELLVQEFDRLQAAQLDCLAQGGRPAACSGAGHVAVQHARAVQFVLVLYDSAAAPASALVASGASVGRFVGGAGRSEMCRESERPREIPAHDGHRPLHGDAGVRGAGWTPWSAI